MSTPPRRTEQGAARLCALTEAAADLFLEKGVDGVSIGELIQRVGGSRRNVYERFGSKEGLFVEVVTRLCDAQAAPLRALDICQSDVDSALQSFGERLLEIVLQPRTLALHRLMIAEGRRYPELSRAVRASGHDAAVAILAGWMTGLPGIRHDVPPQVLAGQFVDLLVTRPQREALIGMGASPCPGKIAALTRQAVSLFLDGARSKDGNA